MQLKAVMFVVEERVGEVRQEVQDYSAAVQSGTAAASWWLDTAAVRTALVNKADDEGRESNVVVFGLEEGEKYFGGVRR